jgi:hypothetical protein
LAFAYGIQRIENPEKAYVSEASSEDDLSKLKLFSKKYIEAVQPKVPRIIKIDQPTFMPKTIKIKLKGLSAPD